MSTSNPSTPNRTRVHEAMRVFTDIEVWMPRPSTKRSSPGPLRGSCGTCCLDSAIPRLEELGFSPSEIDSAIREHQACRRIELVHFKDAPTLVHATPTLFDWLNLPKESVSLNDLEQHILDAISSNKLTGEQIAKRLAHYGCDYDSHLKATLSGLVKRGILCNHRPGYVVVGKSGESQD